MEDGRAGDLFERKSVFTRPTEAHSAPQGRRVAVDWSAGENLWICSERASSQQLDLELGRITYSSPVLELQPHRTFHRSSKRNF